MMDRLRTRLSVKAICRTMLLGCPAPPKAQKTKKLNAMPMDR